ncbi:MAG: class I SAM-dependent methyltransferase [Thermodesulfobacteriota bacterium]
MQDRELQKKYFQSIFSKSNILSKEEFESTAVNYEKEYGGYLPKEKDAAILDIGCGAGHFLYFLEKKGYKNYFGIDISEEQVDFCKQNISGSVELFDAYEFLKDKDGVYDLIVANDFLEHTSKEKVIEILQLIHRSLKKSGKLIIKTPNMSNPFALDSRYKDFTHETGFTGKSLYQVLSVAGFSSIRIYPSSILFPSTLKGIISRLTLKIFRVGFKKIFALQGYAVPEILSKNLIAVVIKE